MDGQGEHAERGGISNTEKVDVCDYVRRRKGEQPDTSAKEAETWEEDATCTPRSRTLSCNSFHGDLDMSGIGMATPPPLLYSRRKAKATDDAAIIEILQLTAAQNASLRLDEYSKEECQQFLDKVLEPKCSNSAAAPPSPAVPPPPPKEKSPIPKENQVLQDVFEELRLNCAQAAVNPQIKRKLDDVARKLENLYDRLRENALAPATTHGLHQIVQAIQQNDYATALSIHSYLVSSSNFSETSSFLPGLKALLQVAQQLGVFVQ